MTVGGAVAQVSWTVSSAKFRKFRTSFSASASMAIKRGPGWGIIYPSYVQCFLFSDLFIDQSDKQVECVGTDISDNGSTDGEVSRDMFTGIREQQVFFECLCIDVK